MAQTKFGSVIMFVVLTSTLIMLNIASFIQLVLLYTAQVEAVELSNRCGDIAHGEGPLRLNITLSSHFPALSHQQLLAELRVNFTLIPTIPNTEDSDIDSIMDTTDITEAFNTQWRGGRSVQLDVRRTAVPSRVMERITGGSERFRAQVKLVLNGVTAAEWSPVCESPIFQSCLNSE